MPGLPPGIAELVRWAPRLVTSGIVLTAALMAAVATGVWPEPLLDLMAAVFFFAFALVAIDADAYRDADRAFSSIHSRAISSAIWLAIAMSTIVLLPGTALEHGFMAVVFGAAFPLVPLAAKGLHGAPAAESRDEVVDRESAGALSELLAHSLDDPIDTALQPEALRRSREVITSLNGGDLRKLIGSLPSERGRGNEFGDPRAEPRLARFVASFPPLGGAGVWELRLMQLARLIYQTAEAHDAFELNTRPEDPSRWRILACYCLERLGQVARDPDERLSDARSACVSDFGATDETHAGAPTATRTTASSVK